MSSRKNVETQSWTAVTGLAVFSPSTPPHERDMARFVEMSIEYTDYDLYKCETLSGLQTILYSGDWTNLDAGCLLLWKLSAVWAIKGVKISHFQQY